MQYMHMIYMYLYKRYVGDLDIFMCYIAPVQNLVPSGAFPGIASVGFWTGTAF